MSSAVEPRYGGERNTVAAQRQFTEIEWESAFENSLDNIFITIIL